MTFAVPDTPDWANSSVTVNAPEQLYRETLIQNGVKSINTPQIDVNAYSTVLIVLVGENTFGMDALIEFQSSSGIQSRHTMSVGVTPTGASEFNSYIVLPSPGGNLEVFLSADTIQDWGIEVQIWGILHSGIPLDTVTVLTGDPNPSTSGHIPSGEGASFGLTITSTTATVSLWPMVFRPGLQEFQYYLTTPITAGDIRFNVVDLRTGRVILSRYHGPSSTTVSDILPFHATAPYRIDVLPAATLAPDIPLDASVTVPTVLGRQ